ncbi:MAG: hypothetical protein JNK79_16635 [Chitinophagaceae bacterium]|nr:hypothetical protein [Chitinophagaceae bacterium]
MLVTSKFRTKVAGPVVIIVMIIALVALISYIWSENPEAPWLPMVAFYVPMAVLGLMMIFGELRRRTIKVTIDSETITVRRYLGWGREELHFLNAFEGYHTTQLQSRYGSYEYLYLMQQGKKVIKLSEFYHKNYNELKEAIATKVKFAGNVQYSWSREMKEFFQ